ncbi:N-acetyl-D-Glu racemase DgcA [Hyphococcus sp.]|uniref:N-acetyl-D-Glu racemase DgcA n=1 Tax=Hyphococcus sp. TaxID=2038636 RepID=UPI003CCBAB20
MSKTEWPLRAPFRITDYVFESIEPVLVTIAEGDFAGRGEGVSVYYCGETADGLVEQIEAAREEIERGIDRTDLQSLMVSGGARNAVDCALWDLETKLTGKTIWELTGLSPKPCQTVFTIGIEDSAEAMARKAATAPDYPTLKVKLDAHSPVERIAAIRNARPDACVIVDANQAFTIDQLSDVLPALAELGVAMVEQPMRRGDDEPLEDFVSPIPLCADESCLHRGELAAAAQRYDMINIKLDKTGGLTEALALAREARALGKGLMVGNMLGSSLSMAPALVIAQFCDFVDLDGPLNQKTDYPGGILYEGPNLSPPSPGFWGGL